MGENAKKENFVFASDGSKQLTGIAFSQDGTQVHISVDQGIVINTYNVARRELIKQVGRGKHAAMVNSMSSNGVYLAACSDRGTTHLYNVEGSMAQSQNLDSSQKASQVNQSASSELKSSQGEASKSGSMVQNTFSKLYYLSSFVPYYGHEFSFARLANSTADQSTEQIVHITNEMVYMVTNKGNHYASEVTGFETKLTEPNKFIID